MRKERKQRRNGLGLGLKKKKEKKKEKKKDGLGLEEKKGEKKEKKEEMDLGMWGEDVNNGKRKRKEKRVGLSGLNRVWEWVFRENHQHNLSKWGVYSCYVGEVVCCEVERK